MPAASVSDLFHPAAVRIGIVNLLVFVGFMGFNAFIADYAEEFDIDDARWLLLTYSLTVMAMRVASAKVFMRVPRRALATFAHGTVVAGALLWPPPMGSQLYVAAFVIAVGMAWNVPLLILIAVDSATDADGARRRHGDTFGDLANSAGTLALGFVAESVGYDGMYVVVAGSALAALVLMRSPFMAATAASTSARRVQRARSRSGVLGADEGLVELLV